MERYQLAPYSWAEIHDMERGDKIILISLGSTEQEGIHLPIGVDTYVAEAIAQAVAKETIALLALPYLWDIQNGFLNFQEQYH